MLLDSKIILENQNFKSIQKIVDLDMTTIENLSCIIEEKNRKFVWLHLSLDIYE